MEYDPFMRNPYYGEPPESKPISQEEDSILKLQLELQKIANRICFILEGYKVMIDKEGNEIIDEKSMGKPLLNKEGIDFIRRQLYTILNVNTILSNLSERQIRGILYEFMETIIINIFHNRKRWTPHPPLPITIPECMEIINIIERNVEITLSRALNGKERELLRKHISVIVSETPEKKRRFLGGVLG